VGFFLLGKSKVLETYQFKTQVSFFENDKNVSIKYRFEVIYVKLASHCGRDILTNYLQTKQVKNIVILKYITKYEENRCYIHIQSE
jgi:hypothetical protein